MKNTTSNRRCLVFATWIPKDSLKLGRYYLELFGKHHPDTDIYLGINHGSCAEWVDLVWNSPLNITPALVPRRLHINSDVAGFVEALRMLKESGKKYDAVWFAHSKGASYGNFNRSRAVREYFEKHFWSNTAGLEHLLLSDRKAGLVANRLMIVREQEHIDHSHRLGEFFPFSYQPIGHFPVETFYVMRGDVVHTFLEGCHPSFFQKNLVTDLGFNRWFFEATFPAISDRMGYEPRASDTVQDRLEEALASWRADPKGYKARAVAW